MARPRRFSLGISSARIALATSAIVLPTAGAAGAHFPHFDGKHEDHSKPAVSYGGSGRYKLQLRVKNGTQDSRYAAAVAHAIEVWSEVGGAVQITAVDNGAPADVVFKRVNKCADAKHAAKYRGTRKHPRIDLNGCRLDGASEDVLASVAAHELGHALGLPHLGRLKRAKTMLMARGQYGQVNRPKAVDRDHYRQAWGNAPGDTGPFTKYL
jgi:hypothetical protein